MVQIVVDATSAGQIQGSKGPVEILGPEGVHLGYVRRSLHSPEEIQEALRRSNDGGPWYTTEQVLAHLRSLEGQ
jgi:hypothetical protein